MTETTKPTRFRKQPVVIEAMHLSADTTAARGGLSYNDRSHAAIAGWMFAHGFSGFRVHGNRRPFGLLVETLEGDMLADPGDWIIRGVKGEFYPCKSDIFEATYERVDDDERTDSASRRVNPMSDINPAVHPEGDPVTIDLTEAVVVASHAIHEAQRGVGGQVVTTPSARTVSATSAALRAALPFIEKQIRAQVADDLRAEGAVKELRSAIEEGVTS